MIPESGKEMEWKSEAIEMILKVLENCGAREVSRVNNRRANCWEGLKKISGCGASKEKNEENWRNGQFVSVVSYNVKADKKRG